MSRAAPNRRAPSGVSRDAQRSIARAGALAGAPLYRLGIRVDNLPGGERRVTLTVLNADGRALPGQFLVRLWISDALGGTPVSTQTTVFDSGAVVQEITAGGDFEALTDNNGEVVFRYTTLTPGEPRYLGALVVGQAETFAA